MFSPISTSEKFNLIKICYRAGENVCFINKNYEGFIYHEEWCKGSGGCGKESVDSAVKTLSKELKHLGITTIIDQISYSIFTNSFNFLQLCNNYQICFQNEFTLHIIKIPFPYEDVIDKIIESSNHIVYEMDTQTLKKNTCIII